MKDLLLWILPALAMTCACGGNSATSPASTTPTVGSPTATENWSGVSQPGGSTFYSFVVSLNGTVNVTLVSVAGVAGVDVPPTTTLGLAIGTPRGTGCNGIVTNVTAGTDPQITTTYMPGRYCVDVADVGNLTSAATFTVTIAHP